MLDAVKEKTTRIIRRASFTMNAATLALIGFAWIAASTGHFKADLEFPGMSLGGGTEQHAERAQQLAALSAAIPATAITPSPAKAEVPPRKPLVRQ